MDSEDDGLTPEERATLAELQDKKARAAWQAQEADRTTALANFEPLIPLLTSTAINAMVSAINAVMPNIDREMYNRLDRISMILRYDALPVAQQIEALSQPTPAPTTVG